MTQAARDIPLTLRRKQQDGPDGRPCNGRGGRSVLKINQEAEPGSTRRPDAGY
jgi:hypothetical protein